MDRKLYCRTFAAADAKRAWYAEEFPAWDWQVWPDSDATGNGFRDGFWLMRSDLPKENA